MRGTPKNKWTEWVGIVIQLLAGNFLGKCDLDSELDGSRGQKLTGRSVTSHSRRSEQPISMAALLPSAVLL